MRRCAAAGLLAAISWLVLGTPGTAVAGTVATHQVVVIAVPDLRWADLESMPALSAYAASAAVGDLSVRGEPAASRCADGSLTFAAGNRADAGGTTSCTVTGARWQRLRSRLSGDRYGADIGALGSALTSAGLTTAAVGPGADLLLGNASGQVSVTLPLTGLAVALRRADVVAVVDAPLYDATGSRATAARAVDAVIAGQLARIPAADTVIVAGTSDGRSGGPHLHALLVHGPGWRHVQLTSASAGGGYVQLVDLAPTVLAGFHLSVPAGMIGRPVTLSSHRAQSAAAYADVDRHAVVGLRFDGVTRTLFGALGMLVVALVAVARRSGFSAARPAAVIVSRFVVGLPLASYLIQLVPWWRWHAAGFGAAEFVVTAGLAAMMSIAARRGRASGLLAVPTITVLVLLVDQLLGAPLQDGSPLGNQPVTAGRFTGIGNIPAACLCAGALLTAGVVAGSLRAQGRRRLALAVAAGICLVTLAVDAAPPLGDDFGGMLALTPAAVLLVAMLAGIRLTWTRLGATVVGVVVLATGLAAADYSRPAADRTHIGTFFGQLIHGDAGKVISRKLYGVDHSFGNVAVTGLVVFLVVGVVAARRQVGGWLSGVPGLTEAVVAVAVLAVLGSALNDSGVVIATFAAGLALLAIVGAGIPPPATERTD